MSKAKTNFTKIADSILSGVDYDIYKDDCNEMDHELRDEIEVMLRRHFAGFDEMYQEIEREHAALMREIHDIVVEDDEDAKKLEAMKAAAKRKAGILAKARGEHE